MIGVGVRNVVLARGELDRLEGPGNAARRTELRRKAKEAARTRDRQAAASQDEAAWGLDGPPGATGVLSGRGGRKRGPLTRSNFEVIHLIQGCHCALLQKLCKLPKSQPLDP